MAYNSQSSQSNDNYVNPADLACSPYDPFNQSVKSDQLDFSSFYGPGNGDEWSSVNPNDLTHSHQDSAVDLRGFYEASPGIFPRLKTEDSSDYSTLVHQTPYSTPASNTSNTPSPNGDMIFSNNNSNANSPGDYQRDQSQTSSPEANIDFGRDSIFIPQSVEPISIDISVDKTKTRAETQIKTCLILDPLPRHFQWAKFPRHTLSKSKQLASNDETVVNEAGNAAVHIDLTLVCATAIEKSDDLQRALRRARGEEQMPTRQTNQQVSEIDKDDPKHPQNGGAVIICEGCKERERKRYDRKKKRNQEEENEWTGYEDQRIIMINEKEFKRWQDVEPGQQRGPDAKKVEFAMRITCYCRHQEEKSPVGYKVIFTFRDCNGTLLNQRVSDIIQITDDHKNREMPVVTSITTDLSIHPPSRDETMPAQYNNMPMFNNYPAASVYGMYSQPTTPIMSQFQSPLSPMDGHYPQTANPALMNQMPHQNAFAFSAGPIAAPAPAPAPSYASHQRYQSYSNTPMLSPTEQYAGVQAGYPLVRPHSMDNFATAFANMAYPHQTAYSQPFASQPPSRNVSRPASPSWDQGPSRAKKMRAVPGFFMEDPDNE
jgi:hypothetical protein